MSDFSFVKIFFLSALFLYAASCSQNNVVRPRYYQPTGYENFYRPDSGLYQNPYQQAPRNYYPYYDSDYYYVPPAGYSTHEASAPRSNVTPADNKY